MYFPIDHDSSVPVPHHTVTENTLEREEQTKEQIIKKADHRNVGTSTVYCFTQDFVKCREM